MVKNNESSFYCNTVCSITAALHCKPTLLGDFPSAVPFVLTLDLNESRATHRTVKAGVLSWRFYVERTRSRQDREERRGEERRGEERRDDKQEHDILTGPGCVRRTAGLLKDHGPKEKRCCQRNAL
ncbi:hypothetical protein EYF80_064285 [Liparis tanakae]|uniref:Uncharacterized protein n=1 Tax=Liparis tanakae TaxID=230148 RepID=A0A4Z2EA40_9TELE|nr:hypothetical protein EYF80_064285 [Liparis tanakae]